MPPGRWSQRQFYVAADAGRVAIFRGVSQDLGPISLSRVESESDVEMSDLPVDVQGSVERTIPARDLADAEAKVQRLRAEAIRCQLMAATGTPCGTTLQPTPSVTTPAPGSTTPMTPGTGIPGTPADTLLPSTRAEPARAHDDPRLPTSPLTPPPARGRYGARAARGGELMTTTVEPLTPRTRRNAELLLLILAIGIVLLAWVTTDLNRNGTVPANIIPIAGGFTVLALAVHLVLRWKAAYADPVLLPIVTVLNGLGLVMIHRLDLARGKLGTDGDAYRQIIWTALAVALAVAVIIVLRDHRLLRRYTYVSMAVGFVLLLLPLVPGLGQTINGSQIWISLGPLNFQPGEFAKIALAIFFAGYLVQTRDVLSLAGKRVLGFTFPRGRDLGPILVAWLLAVLILVFQKDLGSALLFFGLFVAMLYVATERVSWIAIGLLLFGLAVAFALSAFTHFQKRVDLWLDPFSPDNLDRSNQLANGLWGMASGGSPAPGWAPVVHG